MAQTQMRGRPQAIDTNQNRQKKPKNLTNHPREYRRAISRYQRCLPEPTAKKGCRTPQKKNNEISRIVCNISYGVFFRSHETLLSHTPK